MTQTPRPVELFVDPVCPFAWITSRWILNATQVREIAPTFSNMSLSVLNEGRDLPADYAEGMKKAWGPARLALAITQQHGSDAFARWYTAWGERFHVQGDHDHRAVAEEALAEADLPADLIDTFDGSGDQLEADLRASQAHAQSMVGDDVGTPVISFGEGVAYFGPVLGRAPKGEDAGRLFDAMADLASIEGLYELKRARTQGLDFS